MQIYNAVKAPHTAGLLNEYGSMYHENPETFRTFMMYWQNEES